MVSTKISYEIQTNLKSFIQIVFCHVPILQDALLNDMEFYLV